MTCSYFSFLVLSVLALLIVNLSQGKPDCKAKLQGYIAKCKTELNLSDEEVAAVAKEPPFPEKSQCLIKCIGQKLGVITADSKINDTAVMSMIREYNRNNSAQIRREEEIFEQCKVLVGTNDCETASKIYTCCLDKIAQNGTVVPD